jgi:hypothetical protein
MVIAEHSAENRIMPAHWRPKVHFQTVYKTVAASILFPNGFATVSNTVAGQRAFGVIPNNRPDSN